MFARRSLNSLSSCLTFVNTTNERVARKVKTGICFLMAQTLHRNRIFFFLPPLLAITEDQRSPHSKFISVSVYKPASSGRRGLTPPAQLSWPPSPETALRKIRSPEVCQIHQSKLTVPVVLQTPKCVKQHSISTPSTMTLGILFTHSFSAN